MQKRMLENQPMFWRSRTRFERSEQRFFRAQNLHSARWTHGEVSETTRDGD